MPDRRELRDRAQDVKEALAGTVGKAARAAKRGVKAGKERVSGGDGVGGEGLGPDRGTMDQEEARLERARQEARREARKEAREERIQEEREEVKEQEKERLQREQRSIVDSLATAMQTDFDGDGEVLAEEADLQTEQEAREDNVATARAIEETREDVAANRARIEGYHGPAGTPEPGASQPGGPPPQQGPRPREAGPPAMRGPMETEQRRDPPEAGLPESGLERAAEEFRRQQSQGPDPDAFDDREQRNSDLPDFDVSGGVF